LQALALLPVVVKVRKILVMSGKGGVGKTTVAVNLAVRLADKHRVGLLDIDLHGPNVPRMLSLEGEKLVQKEGKLVPVKYNKNLEVVSIGFLLESRDKPVIWRGPLKHKLINQFLNDVKWGDNDFFVVDLPPGTGDEAISIAQLIPKPVEAILVSTPQEVSLLDVRKAIEFSRELGLKIVGIIENMSGEIFGSGKVEELAKEKGVRFLGAIGLNKEISRCGDKGKPFVNETNSKEFSEIIKKIEKVND